MLKGKITGLAAIEREDLKQLLDWRNNSEFRKYFREYRELNMTMQEQWFNESVIKDHSTIMFSIRRLSDNQLLGCCGLVYIDWVHRHAEVSLYVGYKNTYIDNEGLAEDACTNLLHYAFKELCLNKIWTEIYAFDYKKTELYKKMGFIQDGILRQDCFYNGRWWDSVILSILASEFKQ
jgi:hypothetical protein